MGMKNIKKKRETCDNKELRLDAECRMLDAKTPLNVCIIMPK